MQRVREIYADLVLLSQGSPADAGVALSHLRIDRPADWGVILFPTFGGSFMNIRVADIHACYELWKSRGAEFITEPKPKYGETRCYIRDPDGYIIEVGQSTPGVTYG